MSSTQTCLHALAEHADHTWINRLPVDPEADANTPNQSMREVREGLYVPVRPTPLSDPRLVIASKDMAEELGLDESCIQTPEFAMFLSGHPIVDSFQSWATPYALSIYGQEMYHNCPFNNGNGYGDGRAISIAEVSLPSGKRWELQLKGAGRTPFARSGDGRAVLRSSIREFLASEAMYHLGVSSTRALSLVTSGSATVQRPWYSNSQHEAMKGKDFIDHPALQRFPPEIRQALVGQLKQELQQPDQMQEEACAITCRTAPSFIRVGHFELCFRRVRRLRTAGSEDEVERAMAELKALFELAVDREYADLFTGDKADLPLPQKVLAFLDAFSVRLAALTADWIRVGYCQGNFNSDNCLVGARTMDYGPFGFIEKFKANWNMWASGGDHFAFLNQPNAGSKNFASLVAAVMPLMEGDETAMTSAANLVEVEHPQRAMNALNDVFAAKMGLKEYDGRADELRKELLELMETTGADWTLFWRHLADVTSTIDLEAPVEWASVSALHDVFYQETTGGVQHKWCSWIKDWKSLLNEQYGSSFDGSEIAKAMRTVSPRIVPREWMLVDAYSRAQQSPPDYSQVSRLHDLFRAPYADSEGNVEYVSRAPSTVYEGIGLGGTAFMS